MGIVKEENKSAEYVAYPPRYFHNYNGVCRKEARIRAALRRAGKRQRLDGQSVEEDLNGANADSRW